MEGNIHSARPEGPIQRRMPTPRRIDFNAMLGKKVPSPGSPIELLQRVSCFGLQDFGQRSITLKVLFNGILRASRQLDLGDHAQAAKRTAGRLKSDRLFVVDPTGGCIL